MLNISAPSLKLLVVTHLGDGDQFIVNTPELEYLDRTYYWAKDLSLENLSSLLEARINTGLSDSGPVKTNILKLLRGIATVKSSSKICSHRLLSKKMVWQMRICDEW